MRDTLIEQWPEIAEICDRAGTYDADSRILRAAAQMLRLERVAVSNLKRAAEERRRHQAVGPWPDEVNLCGIVYRVQVTPDGTVVFTERDPCAFHPSRFMMTRYSRCWYFERCEGGFSQNTMAAHIVGAFRFVCTYFAGDNEGAGEDAPSRGGAG